MRQTLLVIPCLLVFACAPSNEATPADAAIAPTYFHDVKPILDASCIRCHVGGGIAPFALGSFDEAYAFRELIKEQVVSRKMPPWQAERDCQEYLADASLTDDEIATIARWVDGGAQKGNASDAVEAQPRDWLSLSRVDLTLSMPEAYTPTLSPDDYRCFILDWPLPTRMYVSGMRVNPGRRAMVHHAILYKVGRDRLPTFQQLDDEQPGPGYQCFGGPGGGTADIDVGWLGTWVPGGDGMDYPEGTGISVRRNEKVILQLHYNTESVMEPDLTTVDFKLDTEVAREATLQPWTNLQWLQGGMNITAGDPDATMYWSDDMVAYNDTPVPLLIHSAGLHMHLLGSRGDLFVENTDGSETCLVKIPHWDFHWQQTYRFKTPLVLRSGQKLGIECHWDNSENDQPMVDGVRQTPRDLSWGESTTDEMCLGVFYVTEQ